MIQSIVTLSIATTDFVDFSSQLSVWAGALFFTFILVVALLVIIMGRYTSQKTRFEETTEMLSDQINEQKAIINELENEITKLTNTQ